MRKFILFFLCSIILFSCSNKRNIIYVSDYNKNSDTYINKININNIEIGDILKIDIFTVVPEASIPFNVSVNEINNNIELLKIDGYLVDENLMINFPVLGLISVAENTELEFANKLAELLISSGQLISPSVKVRKINSKFTVLGEVSRPGTFSFFDNQLNIFQALGYAGDLLITGKRKDIRIIRHENGLKKIYKFSLTDKKLFEMPYYSIKNNDVIIVDPNFSKVKSSGFIGSPSSISSIASLLLSITLLIINN